MDPSIYLCSYIDSFNNNNNNNPNVSKDISKDIFKNVSYEPFSYRESLVLSNIDAVFSFTDSFWGYLQKQDIGEFSFLLIDGIKYKDYLLYRKPISSYYLLSKDSGEEEIKQIDRKEPEGFDLIVSSSLSREIINQVIKFLKRDGSFISRFVEKNLNELYILKKMFKHFSLFKPLSSKPNEYYVVCQEPHLNNLEFINSSLIADQSFKMELNTFLNQVREFNRLGLEEKDFDIYKAKAIWNLSDI